MCQLSEISHYSTKLACKFKGTSFECTPNLRPNTTVDIDCANEYNKKLSSNITQVMCLKDGSWNMEPMKCTARCGYVHKHATPFILGGQDAKVTDVPWNVGVYAKSKSQAHFEHICQGSIISERIVISASHCFTDNEGVKLNQDYKVGAGKIHRQIDSELDKNQQIMDVLNIYIHNKYEGQRSFHYADIAVVGIKGYFVYSMNVSSICLNFQSATSTDESIADNSTGLVAGWGSTNLNPFSETLKKVEISKGNIDKCKNESSKEHMDKYVTDDKLCGGFNDTSGACQGDSGSGWAFKVCIRIITKIQDFNLIQI